MSTSLPNTLTPIHLPGGGLAARRSHTGDRSIPPLIKSPVLLSDRPDWQAAPSKPWTDWLTDSLPGFGSLLGPIVDHPTPPRFVPLMPAGNPPATTQQGTESADSLSGAASDDALRGFGGADALFGAAGADWLFGDNGNDRLDGGQGSDVLLGGRGYDRYEFSTADWQASPNTTEVIYDSDGEGQIVIDGKPLTLGQKLSDGVWASADGLFSITLSGRSLAAQGIVIKHLETGAQIQVMHWQYGDLGLDVGRFGKFAGSNPITAPIVQPGFPDDPLRPVLGLWGNPVGMETGWQGQAAGFAGYAAMGPQEHWNPGMDVWATAGASFKGNYAQVDLLIEAMGGFSTSSMLAVSGINEPGGIPHFLPLATSIG